MEPLDPEISQAVILDHSEHPRRFGVPEAFNGTEVAYNPLCGDRYTIYLLLKEGVIQDIGFEGHGCAVSKASASMMADYVAGLSATEARALGDRLKASLAPDSGPERPGPEPTDGEAFEELRSLLVVRNAPVRIRCALLGWEALATLLRGDS
jgi:nitrogen fixation NifU-like protein